MDELEKALAKIELYESTLKIIRNQLYDAKNKETILTNVIDNVLSEC
tara:strand:+ start:128 stop:268 length:141 start_codon:yes stop_codon:yes gene_type:complete